MEVMSACRTAVGRLQRNEVVHALPIGFHYAGASSVVGSLWNVNDASTARLMSDFYRRLAEAERDGRTVDRLQILHDAKRELKRKHSDPFHWAPFLYIGNPE